jgi:hypothetical protein
MIVHLVHIGCCAPHHALVEAVAVVGHLPRNLRRRKIGSHSSACNTLPDVRPCDLQRETIIQQLDSHTPMLPSALAIMRLAHHTHVIFFQLWP